MTRHPLHLPSKDVKPRHGRATRAACMALALLMALPAPYATAGLLAESIGSFKVAADLSRRMAQEAAVRQAANAITTYTASHPDPDGDAFPEAPPFIAGAGPAGGGTLPTYVGATLTDGYGGQLGYCVWDNGPIVTGGVNRLPGSATDVGKPAFAVVSAGLDGTFNRTCAQIFAGSATTDDDFVYAMSTTAIQQGVGGTVFYADPVALQTDLRTVAAGAGLVGLRDGELRLVKENNTLWRWDAFKAGGAVWTTASNTYTASNVAITGGTIKNTVIGDNTGGAAAGTFTTLAANTLGVTGTSTLGAVTAGAITATSFTGVGTALTALNASNITSGTLAPAYGGTGINGSTAANGTLLIGNGSGYSLATLTGTINQVNVTNSAGGITLSLPQNLAPTSLPTFAGLTINGGVAAVSGTFTGAVSAASFTGSGAALTSLNGSNITTGTIGAGYGGTGVNGSTAANGSLLIGNGSGFTLATLTGTASQVNVSNMAGAITLSLPQNIAASSSPTFAGQTLTGALSGTSGAFTGALSVGAGTFTNGVTISGGSLVLGSANISGAVAAIPAAGVANRIYIATDTKEIYRDNGTTWDRIALGTNTGGIGATTANSLTNGAYLTGGAFNGSAPITWAVDATSLNTVSKIVARDASGNFSAGTITATGYAGSGASLTGLNGSSVSSGAVGVTFGGTGVNGSAAPNGSLLIGNTTGYTLGTLTGTTNQVNVVNGVGSITLSLPQSIAASSTPTFAGQTLTGALSGTSGTFSGALSAGAGSFSGGASITGGNLVLGSGNISGTFASLPAAGVANRIYIATDTKEIYRDNGTTWDRIALGTNTGGTGATTANSLTNGAYLTGGAFNGSAPITWAVDATSSNTVNKIVARDASGNFAAGAITATSFAGDGAALTNIKLSSLSAATAGNSINNAANAQAWNWQLTGNTTGFNIGENIASTSGTGTQYLARIGTLAGSTAIPFSVASRVTEAFRVDSINPQIVANVGSVSAPSYTFNGSQDTGFYAPAAGQLAASVGGQVSLSLGGANHNTGLGVSSIPLFSTGANNNGIGYWALKSNSSGFSNTATGVYALTTNTTGNENVATGYAALLNSSTGSSNVATGTYALQFNTSGDSNTAIGRVALQHNTTGTNNSAIGVGSGNTVTNSITGSANTFIGAFSSIADTATMAASGNITLLGANSNASGLGAATANAFMTALGSQASVTSINTVVLGRTSDATVIGATADDLSGNKLQVTGGIKGSGNLIIGGTGTFTGVVSAASFSGSGASMTNVNASNINSGTVGVTYGGTGLNGSAAANGSLLIGNGAGYTLATLTGTANQVNVANAAGAITLSLPQGIAASNNPTFAGQTLTGTLTGTSATFTGNISAATASLSGNLTVGGAGSFTGAVSASRLNVVDAIGNLAVGTNSLVSATGGGNVAVGFGVLGPTSTGTDNTGLGRNALASNDTGSGNTGIGRLALQFNVGGSNNTALGNNTLLYNTSGTNNVGVGAFAAIASVANPLTGSSSTFLGSSAGVADTAFMAASGRITLVGANATASGLGAANANAYMTALGSQASVTTANTVVLGRASDATVIGATADDGSGNKLQVTGGIKGTGNLTIGGTASFLGAFTGTSAAFSSGLSLSGGNLVLGSATVSGLASAIGAAGTANRIYIATDTREIFRDNGTTWDRISFGTNSGATGATTANLLTNGAYLTGGAFNGSAPITWAVDATSANTASKIVARDASGNFSAGTITATGFTGSGASLTGLTAGNLTGTIPSAVLGNSTVYIGITAVALNRASGAIALTGITSIDGNAATVTNGVYTTGSYADPAWITSLAAGKLTGTLGVANGGTGATTLTGLVKGNGALAMTAATAGTDYVVGGTTTVGKLITQAPSAASASLQLSSAAFDPTTPVAGDVWNNAGTLKFYNGATKTIAFIDSNSTGNAATATALQTPRTINGVSFNGTANITVTANTTNAHTNGGYLTGGAFDGSAPITWAVDATNLNTVSKIVARDASGNFSAGTITATGFTGGGALLTGLNGSNVGSGTVGTAYGGTGVNGGAAANGSLLIGNGAGYTLATLTGTANQVNVANTAGAITLSLPQNIATTSTPTFGSVTASRNTSGTGLLLLGSMAAVNSYVDIGAATYASYSVATPATIRFVDDGNYSQHIAFRTKNSGAAANVDAERMRITADGKLLVGSATDDASGNIVQVNGGLKTTANLTVGGQVYAAAGSNSAPGFTFTGNNNTGFYSPGTNQVGATAGGARVLFLTNGGAVAVGSGALAANPTNSGTNVAVGTAALTTNAGDGSTTGVNNTAVGFDALQQNSTGFANTAMGTYSQQNVSTGSYNTALGAYALQSVTTGGNNTAVGTSSLNATTGSDNVAVGMNSFTKNTSGNTNTAIGAYAGLTSTNFLTGSNSVFLGASAQPTDSVAMASSGYLTLLGANTRATLASANGAAYATAVGAGATVTTVNSIVLGRAADVTVIGTTADDASGNKLQVTGGIKGTGNLAIGGTGTITGTMTAASFSGSGALLTALNGSSIGNGLVGTTYGGSGINGSAAANGSLLIGNATGYTLATMTGTANQVNVANGAGSITLSLPQSIAATSTPTFAGETLTGGLNGTSATFSNLVTLAAGTTTLAPLKFQTGVNLTTPGFGSVEFDGISLYLTNNSATPTRKTVAFTDSNMTGNAATVTNGVYTTGSYADPAWITSLAASKLAGTIPSAVLGNSTHYIGTTAIALNRASAAQALTGITSIDGNSATVTSGVYTTGSYADPTWITSLGASKITGTLGVANGGTGAITLTGLVKGNGAAAMTTATAGADYVVGGTATVGKLITQVPSLASASLQLSSAAFDPTTPIAGDVWNNAGIFKFYNGATKTIAFIDSNSTGNAATATALQTPRTINGVAFDGTANITIAITSANALTNGAYLTGSAFNGSAPITWAVDATNLNTVSKIVARDASGNFSAGTITATSFSGSGASLTSLNGSNIASGTVGVTYGGTGVNGSTAPNGSLLIGNGTGYTLATLTGTANQVNVVNGAGSVTLSLPQSIAAMSTPTFAGQTLTGALSGTSASLTGNLSAAALINTKIQVQGLVDGGNTRGIYFWDVTDPTWGSYMGTAGAGKSLGGGTAAASLDGRVSYQVRMRAANSTTNGFLWENNSEQALMSLTGDTGNLYTKGSVNALGNLSVAGTSAFTGAVTGTSASFTGNLSAAALINSKIQVQGQVDGGNTRGIYIWDLSDPTWGLYMGTAGAGKSFSGGIAAASLDGRLSHHIRMRAANSTTNGFLWENNSEQALMSLTSDTGNLYTKGSVNALGNLSVAGTSSFTGAVAGASASLSGNLSVGGTSAFTGAMSSASNFALNVGKAVLFNGAGDTNWGIYHAVGGAGNSLAAGTAVSTLDGRASDVLRFRVASAAGTGYTWENNSEQALMSLTSDTGNLYTKGSVNALGNLSVAGISSFTGAVTGASASFTGNLSAAALINTKIQVQGQVDGGNTRGIYIWDLTDSNWGLYMSTAGVGKSLGGGAAPTSLDGRVQHHVRMRAGWGSTSGFLWENHLEQALMSLTGDTGNLYTKGSVNALGNLSVAGTSAFTGAVIASGAVTAASFSGSGASLTSLTAANLSGTIPSAVLGNSTNYIGTTAIALNRASAAQALTGITSIDGNAATVTNGVYTTGSYADPTWIASLAASKLTGTLGVANGGTGATTLTGLVKGNGATAMTAATAGTDYVVGGTATVGKLITQAPSGASASLLLSAAAFDPATPVAGDVWNNAGTLKFYNGATKTIAFTDSNITGNAATATALQTPRTINGVAFDGTSNITIAAVASLSSLNPATAANTINNAGNTQTWNWNLTTAASTGFAIGENTASTIGAGAQYLHTIGTLAASTAIPLKVSTRGVEAFRVDSVNPQIVANAGSATAPSYAFNGTQNTGVFSPSAGQLAVSTAGLERLRISSGGNLLIGSVSDDGVNAVQVTGGIKGTGNLAIGGTGTFTGAVTAASFSGSGTSLTALNGSNVSSGTVGAAYGGTGVNGSAAANGTVLIGNGTGYTLANIIGGTGLSVTNGSGTIALANTGVTSFNTRTGAVVLTKPDVDGVVTIAASASAGAGEVNLALGTNASGGNVARAGNVAIGQDALSSMTSSVTYSQVYEGAFNAALGYQALKANTNGNKNTATGFQALVSNTTGDTNSATGYKAMYSNTTGYSNSSAGGFALYSNTTGTYNTATGLQAMYASTNGTANSATGYNALYTNSTGSYNVGAGYSAGVSGLVNSRTGSSSTFIGTNAAAADTAFMAASGRITLLGADATASGLGAANANAYMTAIGSSASVTTANTVVLGRASDVTVIGATADNLSGNKLQVTGGMGVSGNATINGNISTGGNIGIGTNHSIFFDGLGDTTWAMYQSVAGAGNAPDGSTATASLSGQTQQHLRFRAYGASTQGFIWENNFNTALMSLTSDTGNLSIRGTASVGGALSALRLSLADSTGGVSSPNVVVGSGAMLGAASGRGGNTAIGTSALAANTSGYYNTAVGLAAMSSNTTGLENQAFGRMALNANTSGNGNTAIGKSAGFETSSFSSINANTTGNYNTFVGSYALPGTATQLSYATALGSGALVSTSNTIVLGRASDNTVIGASTDDLSGNKLQVTGGIKSTTVSTTGNIGIAQTKALLLNGLADTNWGMYIATSGAGNSIAAGNAPASLDGRTSYQVRTRAFNNSTAGFIWENHFEQAVMSLTADTGDLYTKGSVNALGNLSVTGVLAADLRVNPGNSVRFGHANQTDANDGTIGAGVFANGLNIVGTQTVASAGRLTTMFGDVNMLNGLTVTNSITLASSGTTNVASQLLFGPAGEGSDTISLGRVNTSYNNSILQLTLGDDAGYAVGSGGDRFQIATYYGGLNVRHTFDSDGSASHAGNLTANSITSTNVLKVGGSGMLNLGTVANDRIFVYDGGGNNYGFGIAANNLSAFVPTSGQRFSVRLGSSAGSEVFVVNGTGNVTATGTITGSSDIRLKENVRMIGNDDILTRLKSLSAYRYNFIRDPSKESTVGVVAQQLYALFPDLVRTGDDGFYSVNYGGLGAVAAAGVGQLAADLDKYGTGVDRRLATNGQLLIGNGKGFTLGTLSAGAGIGIDNSAGNITIRNTGVTGFNGRKGDVSLSLADVNGVADFGAGNFTLGTGALAATSGGSFNTAVGQAALSANGTGSGNTAQGYRALSGNVVGANNVGFGRAAGFANGAGASVNANVSGSNNTFLGAYALPGTTAQLNYATAVGSESTVTTSNTIVLGRASDVTVLGASGDDHSGNRLQVTGGIRATGNLVARALALTAEPRNGLWIDNGAAVAAGNGLVQAGDSTMLFSKGTVGSTAGLVVGPWSGSSAGLRVSNNGVAIAGALAVNGAASGSAAYAVAADARFATSATPIDGALALIDKLQGVRYEADRAGYPNRNFESGKQLGFIAQQIELILPEVVRTDADGYKSVQYSQLTPLLVEGMKAQQIVLKHLVKKDPTTLLVDIKTLQAQDAIFDNIKATDIKTVNLEAETARIKKLEADSIESKSVRSDVVKSGELEVFVSLGTFQPIFVPQPNAQYIVNATAEDGSSAFASVAFMGGKITVTPISGKGVDVTTIGSQVGLVAPSKKIKATWIRMS